MSKDLTIICLGGDIYSYYEAVRLPANFCNLCGKRLLAACENCDAILPHPIYVNRVLVPPSFCTNCGKPFPWTAARLDAANEALDMIEGFSDDDRDSVRKNISDVIQETPRTEVAATKIQRILSKTQGPSKVLFEKVFAPLLVEAAKNLIPGHH